MDKETTVTVVKESFAHKTDTISKMIHRLLVSHQSDSQQVVFPSYYQWYYNCEQFVLFMSYAFISAVYSHYGLLPLSSSLHVFTFCLFLTF